MRNKVLLSVLLPATRRRYEFRVPLDATVEDGAALISRLLAAREPVLYAASEDVDLMLLEGAGAGSVLNPGETFKWYVQQGQLVDGSALALA